MRYIIVNPSYKPPCRMGQSTKPNLRYGDVTTDGFVYDVYYEYHLLIIIIVGVCKFDLYPYLLVVLGENHGGLPILTANA